MDRQLHRWMGICCLLAGVATPALGADPPVRPGTQNRTGTTQRFGSGSLTRRSDGSSSRLRSSAPERSRGNGMLPAEP